MKKTRHFGIRGQWGIENGLHYPEGKELDDPVPILLLISHKNNSTQRKAVGIVKFLCTFAFNAF
jgi:hypothetical protein